MDETFLRTKPVAMIMSIGGANKIQMGSSFPSQIAKDIDCTYSHVVKLMGKMKEKGLVTQDTTCFA